MYRQLSAKYKSDYAYPTMKDRVPDILTKVIDHLYRMKDEVRGSHGQNGADQLKDVTARLSQLKYELQTNKPMTPLPSSDDSEFWNSALAKEDNAAWFTSPWLLAECYFYRRVHQAVLDSPLLCDMDVFGAQKRHGLVNSLDPMITLAKHLLSATAANLTHEQKKRFFLDLLKVNVWGNKCDLSISSGQENYQKANPVEQIVAFDSNVLADDSCNIWTKLDNKPIQRVDIILDNAGFEFFTDLCLAEFLTHHNIAQCIKFHGKKMPWFVSDVTSKDFRMTLSYMKSTEDSTMRTYGTKWEQYMSSGQWVYEAHPFWTTPYDYNDMEKTCPELYKDLSASDLLVFKGDLNYRKLTGDLAYPSTYSFKDSLRGFKPTSLCALRTVKCDTVVGLLPGQVEKCLADSGDQWMFGGDYAVIQFNA